MVSARSLTHALRTVGLIVIIARVWCSLCRCLGWRTRPQATANSASRPNRTVQALKLVIPAPIHAWIWRSASTVAAQGVRPSAVPTPPVETLPAYPGPSYLPSYNQAIRHPRLHLILHPTLIIYLRRQPSPEPDLEAARSEPSHPQDGHIALHLFIPPSVIPTEPPPIYSYADRDPHSPPPGQSHQS